MRLYSKIVFFLKMYPVSELSQDTGLCSCRPGMLRQRGTKFHEIRFSHSPLPPIKTWLGTSVSLQRLKLYPVKMNSAWIDFRPVQVDQCVSWNIPGLSLVCFFEGFLSVVRPVFNVFTMKLVWTYMLEDKFGVTRDQRGLLLHTQSHTIFIVSHSQIQSTSSGVTFSWRQRCRCWWGFRFSRRRVWKCLLGWCTLYVVW